MNDSRISEENWELLLKRINKGKCIPFLGAGVDYGILPLGGEVALTWAKKYGYPLSDTTNLPRVAQYVGLKYDDLTYPKEELAASFKTCPHPDFGAADEPHSVLAKLPLPIYFTTNYDDFMVRALKARDRNAVRDACRWKIDLDSLPSPFDGDYVPTVEKPVVFHLHGHLDEPASMVLTEDDYLDFLVDITTDRETKLERKILPPLIEGAFSDSTILFLGYSLADWNFRVLFRSLIQNLKQSGKRLHISVQLLPDSGGKDGEQMSDAQKQNIQDYLDKFFGDLNIKVFWGNCQDFISELNGRWESFNAGK